MTATAIAQGVSPNISNLVVNADSIRSYDAVPVRHGSNKFLMRKKFHYHPADRLGTHSFRRFRRKNGAVYRCDSCDPPNDNDPHRVGENDGSDNFLCLFLPTIRKKKVVLVVAVVISRYSPPEVYLYYSYGRIHCKTMTTLSVVGVVPMLRLKYQLKQKEKRRAKS